MEGKFWVLSDMGELGTDRIVSLDIYRLHSVSGWGWRLECVWCVYMYVCTCGLEGTAGYW